MPIALTDEHEAQRLSARRWLDTHCPPSVPRALLDAEEETLQPVWKEMAAEGWLGIHLPEEFGGQGFGLFELAVLLEETGWSVVPGPLLPTVVTSALVAETSARSNRCLAAAVLPGLIDGSLTAAVSFGDTHLDVVDRGRDGELVVSGRSGRCSGAATASLVLAPARDDRGAARPGASSTWPARDRGRGRVHVASLASLDPTRRVGAVEVDAYVVSADRQLPSLTTRRLRQVVMALMAAEHVGGARWCLETATEYAKVRVQFGRPIGQFQAVKHRLADMAVRVEQMTAVAWDAAVAVRWTTGATIGPTATTPGHGHRRGAHRRRVRPVVARSACSCWAGSASPGSTTSTSTSSGPMPTASCWVRPTSSAREVATVAGSRGTAPAGRRPTRRGRGGPGGAGPADGRAGRHPGGGAAGRPWSRRAWWCPTGPSPGDGTPERWSRWSSTSSWLPWGSSVPTSGSAPGPCR